MSNNAQLNQVNEDYKFRFSYVVSIFRDLFSASSKIEDKELESQIQEIIKQQDTAHIDNLEKDITTFETKKSKSKNTSFSNVKNIDNKAQNIKTRNDNLNNIIENEEDKEL